MSDLSHRFKQSLHEQSVNIKFMELLNTNKYIQPIKDREILPSIPLSAFKMQGELPQIGREKVKMKLRSMSESKMKVMSGKGREKDEKFGRQDERMKGDIDNGLNGIKISRKQAQSILKNERANVLIPKNIIKIRNKSVQSAKKQRKISVERQQLQRQRIISEYTQIGRAISQKNLLPISIQITPQKFKIDFPTNSNQNTNNTTKHSKFVSNKTIQQIQNEGIENIMLNVKFGKIQENMSYKMFAKKDTQPNSIQILKKLEKWLEKYKIKNGLICTKNLHHIFGRKQIPNNMILAEFTNYDQMKRQLMGIMPGLKYYTEDKNIGENLAAAKIQSIFKMISQKKYAKKLKSLMNKVKIIQRQWKVSLAYKRGREQIIKRLNIKIEKAKALSSNFMKNWQFIKSSPRVQVHICSIALQQFKRLSIQDLHQKQIANLTRIFKAAQADCTIVYVVPLDLPAEVLRYYERVFTFGNKAQNFRDRLYIISVERMISKISSHLTTVAALLYNIQGLKRIKQIIKEKQTQVLGQVCAYIIPSYPSNQYTNLSAELEIPLFSGPQSLCKLYSTKSGYYEFLKPLEQNLGQKCPFFLPKTVHSIYSQKQLINTLAILIHKNKQVKRWILKIDDEVNSRGLAIFNVDSLVFLKQLRKQNQNIIEQSQEDPTKLEQTNPLQVSDKEMISIIADELKAKLKLRLKIVHKNIYSNYDNYMSHFLTRGGFVQACLQPYHHSDSSKIAEHSISFKIEPNGQFQILTTYSRLELGFKTINSTIQCPSSLSTEEVDNEKIIRALYRHIWGKCKLFGYFSIDCLYLSRKGEMGQVYSQIFIIGMDCFLNQKTSSIYVPILTSKMLYQKEFNRNYRANEMQTGEYLEEVKKIKNISDGQNSVLSKKTEDQQEILEPEKQKSKEIRKELHYIYCPFLKLKNLPDIGAFFKQCKFFNISFDIQNKTGTLFLLEGGLESGSIGFMCINTTKEKTYEEAYKLIQFLSQEFRDKNSKASSKSKGVLDQIGQLRGFLLNILRKKDKNRNNKLRKDDLNLQLIF